MKTYPTRRIIPLIMLALLLSQTYVSGQEQCFTPDNERATRLGYTCDDLDELTLEEVLAMPTLNIPVVFHFIAYDEGLNFTCDPDDPILESENESAWLMWVPTFVYYVLNEMNERMADQFRHTGVYSDSRVRYHLLNGTACENSFFYSHTTSINQVPIIPNALNIIFGHDPNGCCQSGYTSTGSSTMVILNSFRNFYINENNDTWSLGRLINHENGHRFSLKHSFTCSNPCDGAPNDGGSVASGPAFNVADECCDTCHVSQGVGCCQGCYGCSDKMMGYGSFLVLTPCEHRELWSWHLNSNIAYHDHCNKESEIAELVYDTGTKLYWTGQRLVNADIIIKTGTEVELSCDLQMGADKKIIVERGARLTLNGGTISSICGFKWKGIRLEGVSDPALLASMNYDGQLPLYNSPLDPDMAGTVVLLNNSAISEAQTAISTYNDHYPWPALENYFGGLIYCEDSEFVDCNRAVEFMRYGVGPTLDRSRFFNTNFKNLDVGVTLWSNNGVLFDNCEFQNNNNEGIVAWDAAITVKNGSLFESTGNAIELLNTYPNPYGHIIGTSNSNTNTFINNEYGIYAENQGSVTPTWIENNAFQNGDYGIRFSGVSYYGIHSNTFAHLMSAQDIISCGDFENVISFNHMENNAVPTKYTGYNAGSSFLNNCYENTSMYDVYLSNTTLFPSMGNSMESAGNCFTKNLITSIYCDNNIGLMRYYTSGPPSSCYYPSMVNCSTINRIAAMGVVPIPCTGPIPIVLGEGESRQADDNVSQVHAEPGILSDRIDNPLTAMYQYVESNYKSTNRIDGMIDYLWQREEFVSKTNAYGLAVYSGNLHKASTYLNLLPASNEQEQDFILTQKINIGLLQNGYLGGDSGDMLHTLSAIGHKSHEYAGYARSIYKKLTGILIKVPSPLSDRVDPMAAKQYEPKALEIKSYPSPIAGGYYSIELGGAIASGAISINVYDALGNRVIAKTEQALERDMVKLFIGDLQNNVYYVTVNGPDGMPVYNASFVKL